MIRSKNGGEKKKRKGKKKTQTNDKSNRILWKDLTELSEDSSCVCIAKPTTSQQKCEPCVPYIRHLQSKLVD